MCKRWWWVSLLGLVGCATLPQRTHVEVEVQHLCTSARIRVDVER